MEAESVAELKRRDNLHLSCSLQDGVVLQADHVRVGEGLSP